MDIKKAQQDLDDLLSHVETERKQFEMDKFKPFADVFHQYDDSLDCDSYKLGINFDDGYNRVIRSFEIVRLEPITGYYSNSTICTFNINNETKEIVGLDMYSSFDFSFNDRQYLLKYNVFRLNFINTLVKIFHNNKDIGKQLLNISNNDDGEYYTTKTKAIGFIKHMLENYNKVKIHDHILKNGGIKFQDALDSYNSVLVNSFSQNESKYIDAITFIQNPSGTYSVKLFNRGNVVDESSRASEDKLNHFITCIVDYLTSNEENLKDFTNL